VDQLDPHGLRRPSLTASLVLYWLPASCARVPLIALEEIGEPFELRLVNKFAREHVSPEYVAINPKSKVPTLVAGGAVLTENPAIQWYLARAYPHKHLLPQGDVLREADVISMLAWFSSGVHPLVTRLRMPAQVASEPGAWDSVRAAAAEQLEAAFQIVERRLFGRNWLYGDWSLADAYLFWLWCRATLSGLDPEPFPRCAAHAERIKLRPSVTRALDREHEEIARQEAAGAFPVGELLSSRPVVPTRRFRAELQPQS
jgi:glutathione S-transferase